MRKLPAKLNTGFTLVEVAVVMVIIGLIVTFAASILRNVGGLTKLRDAKDRVITVADGVSTFAAKNNRLPTFAEFTSASAGFTAKDAWMRTYQPYPRLTFNTTFLNFTGNGLSTFCGRSSTRFAVCLSNSCSGSNLISDVAFAVISNGPNLTLNSTYPSPSGCPTGKVCLAVQEPSNTYDDLYKYITLTELKKAAGCIESESRLKIITSDLPFGNLSTSYANNVSIIASGGVPWPSSGSYKWRMNHGALSGTGIGITSPATFINTSSAPSTAPQGDKLVISGTPISVGTHSFSIVVQDFNGNTYSKPYVITVKPKP